MKNSFLFFALFISNFIFSQAASKVNNSQNVFASGQPRVILSCDTLVSGLFRLYPKAQVTWKFNQIVDKPSTLSGYGITDGVDISSLTWSNITGKPIFSTVATTGSYLDLTNQPVVVSNNNQLTNGSNYITASSSDLLTNKTGNISQWTNNLGYLTSVPAQSFSSLTGKPTTLSGYGITDAYPLTGNPSNFINQSGARTAISLTTTGTGSATYNNTTGVLNIPTPITPLADYTNTVAVAGGAGNATFYLTNDKTSTGIALYTNINYVSPIVNDATNNYTYGWAYNPTTKALTVNVRANTGLTVLGLQVLGAPANIANGTNVQILVKGT